VESSPRAYRLKASKRRYAFFNIRRDIGFFVTRNQLTPLFASNHSMFWGKKDKVFVDDFGENCG
jgi:hypothetical protein